jgi:hypothetical protein
MADNDKTERRVLSAKELAKEQRRAAYQRQKSQRASDPRYLAMKAAAKEQRRAAYQRLKESRKAEAAASKRSSKERRANERAAELDALKAKHQHTNERAKLAASAEAGRVAAQSQTELGRAPFSGKAQGEAFSEPSSDAPMTQPQPVTQDTPSTADEIAESDAGLWKYVTWANNPKLLN